jgi:hypothetical protein
VNSIREASLMLRLPARLENWRNWLRTSPVYGQCASLEGNFRSPQVWYPPGARPLDPNEADAWDLNLAAATLSIRLHLFLRLRYLAYGLDDHTIAKIIRVELRIRTRGADVPGLDYEAKAALLEALDAPVVVRRARAVAKVLQIMPRYEDLMLD